MDERLRIGAVWAITFALCAVLLSTAHWNWPSEILRFAR